MLEPVKYADFRQFQTIDRASKEVHFSKDQFSFLLLGFSLFINQMLLESQFVQNLCFLARKGPQVHELPELYRFL